MGGGGEAWCGPEGTVRDLEGGAHSKTSYANGTQLTHAPTHTNNARKKSNANATAHKCEETVSMAERDKA